MTNHCRLPQPLRRKLLLAATVFVCLLLHTRLRLDAQAEAPPAASETVETPATLGEPVGLGDAAECGCALFASDIDDVYLPAPVLDSHIEISVTGLIARARVTQRFWNSTEQWVEGVYVFPLPESAAVDTLRMTVGDRLIEGEIQEREQAQQTYLQAKSEGKKASLVEQHRPNVFSTRFANLGPNEILQVSIELQFEARYDTGTFELRFPTVVAPRYTPERAAALDARRRETGIDLAPVNSELPGVAYVPSWADPSNAMSLEIELDAGLPLELVESPSHGVLTRAQPDGRQRVTLEHMVERSDRDFVLTWRPRAGGAPGAVLFTEDYDGERYAYLMVMPPAAKSKNNLPREIVLVLDTSGSMSGTALVQAREALLFALGTLRPGDSFNVIRFSDTVEKLYAGSVAATEQNVTEAREWVSALEVNGGTEMLGALRTALDGVEASPGQLRQVVFVTDGAVSNEEELFEFIQANLGGSRLFTVGIGAAPNAHFMTRAAEIGRGTYTFIANPAEVRGGMASLFAKLESPVWTDLRLGWEGDGGPEGSVEMYPERIPDLYRGEPVVVAARLAPGAGTARLSGHGDASWNLAVQARAGNELGGIAKLWARRKIRALEGELSAVPDPVEARRGIVELALGFHLVSRFTSLVAVDRTPTAPDDVQVKSTRIPLSLPAGWQGSSLAVVLPQGATAGRLDLLLGLTLLLLGLAGARLARRSR